MDRVTYKKAVEGYANVVFRVAYSYCKNQSDAEDIMQNTFLKLLQGNYEFCDEEHLKKWLIRVAINEAKNVRVSFWKRKVVPISSCEEKGVSFDTLEQSMLFEAVRELTEKYRVVIHLYYYEGYAIKEIADILGIKETTVQTQLMRARGKLKERLGEAWKDE